MATSLQKKAPAATGASLLAQQCEHAADNTTLVSRGEYAWNVFHGETLIGSFIGFERANALATEWVIT